MEYMRSALQRFRESLFFLPLLMVLAFMILARVTFLVDRDFGGVGELPFVVTVSASGGRSIATAVAGATITVAAIVFSITALTSQLAATQYSPRSVAGFFEDQFQQLVIGLVVGTFTYSLLVLAHLGDGLSTDDLRASLSATLVIALGVSSVVSILAYLDHSLRRMRIGAVVRRISEETLQAVKRQYRSGQVSAGTTERETPSQPSLAIDSERIGWVRAIDARRLARSLEPSSLVRIEVRVGEAVFPRDHLATYWGTDAEGSSIQSIVRGSVHIGRERTLSGDPSYGIRQLVDIALRALSPGINDPTTAIDVVHHLKLPVREIMLSDRPTQLLTGTEGQRVYLPESPSRSDLVHAAFSEVRLAASGHPGVLRSLLEVLSDLISDLETPEFQSRAEPLVREGKLVVEAARAASLPDHDLERVLAGTRNPLLLDFQATT